MRDKNLTYSQFNIQLSKNFERVTQRYNQVLTEAVIDSPTVLEENWKIIYPRNFRLMRVLAITQWSFPEILHWKILLDLKEMSFSHFNGKQRIELQLYLESEEICRKYLYETERYSSNEIFGNLLGNDLEDLFKTLRFQRKHYYSVTPKRKRGYNDHGSRRPDYKWLPDKDFELTELYYEKQRKLNQELKTIHKLIKILRSLRI